MKIGKATVPRSAICTSNADTIVVRGQDLARDLIGQVNFGDYFFFLLTGRKPDAAASAVLNATLVAIAEHGLVPSVQAARMTLAAAPEAMQGAVAAGILGCGLGDPGRLGNGGPPVRRDRRGGAEARRRPARGGARRGRRRGASASRRSPATATRNTRSATARGRAVRGLAARPAAASTSSRSPRLVEDAHPRRRRQGPAS